MPQIDPARAAELLICDHAECKGCPMPECPHAKPHAAVTDGCALGEPCEPGKVTGCLGEDERWPWARVRCVPVESPAEKA
jgi:hypothetical protein